MTITQTIPQAQINEIFEAAPSAIEAPLLALIIGPDYAVRRYSTNKAAVLLGTYAGGTPLVASWPGILAGEVVDQTYTALNLDNAALAYYVNPSSDVTMVSAKLNLVTSSSLTFAASPGHARSGGIPTDVQVGDQVVLTESSTTLVTTVTGLIPNVVASSIGSATAIAGNIATAAGSSAVTAGGSNAGTSVPTVSGLSNPANYAGQNVSVHGQMSETYTVTCTAAGSDCLGNTGGWTSGRFSVTSASGTDAAQSGLVVVPATPFAIGSRGARLELSHGVSGNDLVVGDSWTVAVTQTFTATTEASGGTYTGPSTTTYVITVTKGGVITGSPTAQIQVSTTTGIDLGGPYTVTSGSAIVLGSLGVTVTFTGTEMVIGDSFTILATAASAGAIQTLALANNLPTALQSGSLGITLAILGNIVLPAQVAGNAPNLNWTGGATLITLAATMKALNARTGATPLTVLSGTAYATYRALRTAGANKLQSCTVASDIAANGFWGVDDIDSPLTYGVNRALSNAAGTTVQALSIASDTLAGYTAALATLNNREDFYRVVALTSDATTLEAVVAYVVARSGPTIGRWATTAIGLGVTTLKQVGPAALATVTLTPNSGGQYLTVTNTDGTALYITNGVQPGDNFRAGYTTDGFGNVSYTTYIVNTVVSEQSLTLVAGPSLPISVASISQAWHPLSVSEQATDIGTRSQAISGGNRRVTSVFPAAPARGGQVCPSYFLACSLAGLRAAAVPQQGLTNTPVLDWDDMSQASITFANQLVNLMQYGMYIVTQAPIGTVYILKQLTCDTTAIPNSEDSVTVNCDSCAYVLKGIAAPFIGNTNVVVANINALKNALIGGITQLQNANYSTNLGGQMGPAAQLVYVRQNAFRADALSARINGDFPLPINNLFIDLVVATPATVISTTGTNANSQPG